MSKIKIGIIGYGNLGRGVEAAIKQQPDMELVAVFTRREPNQLSIKSHEVPVVHVSEAPKYQGKIDVMILCGGSATDLPEQVPTYAQYFNTVDSFDTHALIPPFYEKVNDVAERYKKVSIISVGWDPGLFSLNRLIGEAVLPVGETYTFWGNGLSQGHSDAIRRVAGVKNGVQYTIPIQEAVNRVRSGENPQLSTREKHERVCYVVLDPEVDSAAVEKEIVEMPNYFADYNTTVHFISEEELNREHSGMPHGGFVIRSGETGEGDKQLVEYSLKLNSNPMFTASVLVAYARAAKKFSDREDYGAKTVFDVPFGYLSSKTPEQLRKELL